MKKFAAVIAIIVVMIFACACADKENPSENVQAAVNYADLKKTGSMELKYAAQFSVDEYSDKNSHDYKLITIENSGKFLVVNKNEQAPDNVPEDVTVLKQPLDNIYLVASACMDLICKVDGASSVKFTGTKQKDWYVQDAVDAMESGSLTYAGKYSAPDYELLLNSGCDLAIENTMINHNPEVKEKLEELGIPVLVEMSSYESHPLGRLEWIKLFGVLLGKEDEAVGFFDAQVKEIEPILKAADTADEKADAKSVAICAVTSNGSITVRKPNDYVSKMISLAGGKYALSDYVPEEENALSTMNMQMEDFYAAAKDADILIYNGTIEGELGSIEELTSKNELFADFKAVKDGQVYTTDSSFYQQTTGTCDFIKDLNQILQGNDTDYRFLTKLK